MWTGAARCEERAGGFGPCCSFHWSNLILLSKNKRSWSLSLNETYNVSSGLLFFFFYYRSPPQVRNQNILAPLCKHADWHRTDQVPQGRVAAESRQVNASGQPTPTALREVYFSSNEVVVKVELQMCGGQVGQHKSTVCRVHTDPPETLLPTQLHLFSLCGRSLVFPPRSRRASRSLMKALPSLGHLLATVAFHTLPLPMPGKRDKK